MFPLSALITALAVTALNTPVANNVSVRIAVDNKYEIYFPEGVTIPGPKDGDNGIAYGWKNTKQFDQTLTGSGPWVVGIKATDYGVISGLWAGVNFNGKPYTASGVNTTLFKATTIAPTGNSWLTPAFDDSTWLTGIALATPDCRGFETSMWGAGFVNSLNADKKYPEMHASWLPNCQTVHNVVYFRVVIQPEDLSGIDINKNSNEAVPKPKKCRTAL